jgi:hypothetical protein
MNAATNLHALPSLPLCPEAERYSYHIVVSSACMPNSCWGVYKRVALVRIDHHERVSGFMPKVIREGRGIKIERVWDKLNVGTTDRCAFKVALREATELLADLSA